MLPRLSGRHTGEDTMHPADEFALLRARLRILRLREEEMREMFLAGQVRLRSNAHEVSIKMQHRRLLRHAALPSSILHDPVLWRETSVSMVSVARLDCGA